MADDTVTLPVPLAWPSTSLSKPTYKMDDRQLTACGSLAAALAQARDRCKAAAKTAKNTFHRYTYASADEIIATASDALEGSGLGLIPLREELTVVGQGTTSVYALNRSLLLAHSSGEYVVLEVRGWPVVPERGKPLDKAFAIALTSSLSYKLRDLLQMPRVDPSDDVAAQRDHQTPATPPPPQQEEQQEEAGPDPQTPSVPAEELTETELDDLRHLAIQHKRTSKDMIPLLAALGVPVLRKAPRVKLDWIRQALTTGLTTQNQVDRISGLVTALKLDWNQFRSRLQAVHGVTSIAHLLPTQADQIEQALKAKVPAS